MKMYRTTNYYKIIFWTVLIFLLIPTISLSQIVVNSIAELRTLSPGAAPQVNVSGYYSPGDGGGGTFIWNTGLSIEDNYGTIIIPNSLPTNGRWERIYDDFINVLWFGAKGDDIPNDINHIRIQAALDFASTVSVRKVFIPPGVYQINGVIRLRQWHNGIDVRGEINYTTATKQQMLDKMPDRLPWVDVVHRRSPYITFRVVDESNSTIIKRQADVRFWNGSKMIFVISTDTSQSGVISNITLNNFALNGNRQLGDEPNVTFTGGGSLYISSSGASQNIVINNIASYNSTGNAIHLRTKGIIANNLLAYNAGWHGIANGNGATVNGENWEAHHCGILNSGFFGAGWSAGTFILNSVFLHHNGEGSKTTIYTELLDIDNYTLEYNYQHGFTSNATGTPHGKVHLRRVNANNNGWAGVRLTYHAEKIIDYVIAQNNGWNNSRSNHLYPNIFLGGVKVGVAISEDYNGYVRQSAWFLGETEVEYLKVRNNNGYGARFDGSTKILSGDIYNNTDIGIFLSGNINVEIYNVRFGDNQDNPTQTKNEIYGPDATFKFGNLDFSDSKVTEENRIKVQSMEEVGAIRLNHPDDGNLVLSDGEVMLTVNASHPSGNIAKVEYYANGNKIGETSDTPFSFQWTDLQSGSFTITAMAIFTDNSTAISNSIRITVDENQLNGSHKLFLYPGWNLISTYIQPDNTSIGTLLGHLKDSLTLVTNSAGLVFWPAFNLDGIHTWDVNEGYQIFMETADTLTITGVVVSPTNHPIELQAGWNIGAYLSDGPLPVHTAVQNIQDQLSLITNNSGDIYCPEYEIFTLHQMEPGKGYRFYMKESASLIYPNVSVTSQSSINTVLQSTHFQLDETSKHYQLDFNNTGSSSILLLPNVSFDNEDEIGVWGDNNSLVGSASVQNGKAAITIWGKNNLYPTCPEVRVPARNYT
jgi:hypothetical protein